MTKDKQWQFFFFVTLLIWCFALAYPINPDYDLFARMIVGKSVIENGLILKQDFYSYTPTHIWYDHEWGASAIIYLVSKLSDVFKIHILYVLSALKSVLIFFIFLFAAICVKVRTSENSPFNILYFSLAIFASNIVFASTVRCHMFSFLFFALFVLILECYRLKGCKWLLVLLPILMLFWGNIHGGCLSGIGLLVIYSFGEFFNKKNPVPYFLTLIVSFAVLFLNPYGCEYVRFLFTAGTMNRELISEWASPFAVLFFALKFKIYFLFMSVIALFRFAENKLNLKNIDMTKLLLLVVTGYIAVMHTKLLPFFVISSAIFMFDDVFSVINKIDILKRLSNTKNKYVFALILLLSLCTFQNASIPQSSGKNTIGVTAEYLPYRAIEFIKKNHLRGNLLLDMKYGSYAAYRLYPDNKIYMDGRYEEVYSPELLVELKDFFTLRDKNFDDILTKYPTDIILLEKKHTAKLTALLKEKNWQERYTDHNFNVLVRPDYPNTDDKKVFFDSKMMFDTNITFELLKNFGG